MIVLKDWITIIYMILGISLILIYLFLIHLFLPKEKQGEDKLENQKIEALFKMYETFNNEIQRRGNLSILTGTIFITAAFLILGSAATARSPANILLTFISFFIYVIWLFCIQYTGNMLDEISYNRARGIEKRIEEILQEKFEVHRYIRERTECTLWLKARRMTWWFILVILFVGGLTLLITF